MAFEKVWRESLIFKLNQNYIFGNLLNLSHEFLRNRKERVLLKVSYWSDVRAGVPKGSILDPLLFLTYIKDLSVLSLNAKLFADDTSLIPLRDLEKINSWAFQWKMSFNPDHKKQAQEVIFSRTSRAISHFPRH